MNDYKLQIINAAFVASGVATQAKGVLYGHRPDKGMSLQKAEDYRLGTLSVYQAGGGTYNNGGRPINRSEDSWDGSGDYWLGRSVLTDLIVNVPGEGLLQINDATINVSLQKQIVQTALVGRAGTIKEYITDGDYQINISVGLVSVDSAGVIIDQYPENAVNQLREILTRPESLEVNSLFLDVFNINRIVVTGFSARQMTYSNRQVIEITALSDSDYVIEAMEY